MPTQSSTETEGLRSLVILAAGLALLATAAYAEGGARTLQPKLLKIVNGEVTSDFESTVAVLDASERSYCSGVLIGCSTVLTAAHCLCDGTGAECGDGGPGLITSPDQLQVFTQHGGIFDVASFDVHEGFEFGVANDVALLHLAGETSGIRPSRINDVVDPPALTPGLVVGFGLTSGALDTPDSGLKRSGAVTLADCSVVPAGDHLCWRFAEPLGAPGDDSNTCEGDSGGPLLVEVDGELRVAGVASGGTTTDCQAPDEGFDTNIFVQQDWIRDKGGVDVERTVCGQLPAAGDPGTMVVEGRGELGPGLDRETWELQVPAGTQLLRVSVNGEDPEGNDFDLSVRFGADPNGVNDACSSVKASLFESCDVIGPEPGKWHFAVDRLSGEGEYQIVVVAFPASEGELCVPTADNLCLGENGRFKVSVRWRDFDGNTGSGKAVAIGRRDSGLFYFFDADNIELMVKVLKACGINQHYWVFSGSTTTVEYRMTVEDTQRGVIREYTKAIDTAAPPVTDTTAFETCP